MTTDWENIEALTGYKPIADFYEQLEAAEQRGVADILPARTLTLFRVEKAEFLKNNDPKRLTELSMALNWRMWYHAEHNDIQLSRNYERWWRKVNTWCLDNMKGDALSYYIRTTD